MTLVIEIPDHYPEFVDWCVDNKAVDHYEIQDMFLKPGKYQRDYEEWLDWAGEADADRRAA